MGDNTNPPKIERFYKLPESEPSKEAEPFYWHLGGRMGLNCVCGLLRVKEDYFKELALVHGCQTANKITSGEITVPLEHIKKVRYNVDFKAISDRCGVPAATVRHRYKRGERGAHLERPLEHGGGARK